MPAFAEAPAKAAPQRFACLFIGDGISPPHWWAKGDGAAMELGSSLQPLAPFKEKINVIHGLCNREGDGGHAKCTGNILSGAALQRGRTIKGGVSMDQLLAKHFEEETAQPSLVLGCEQPVSGFHESQYSMVYASHISWRNADSPVPIELYPALAFDSLFGGKTGKLQGSILDDVLGQAKEIARPGQRGGQAQAGRIPGQRPRDRGARTAAQQTGEGRNAGIIGPLARPPDNPRTSANTPN